MVRQHRYKLGLNTSSGLQQQVLILVGGYKINKEAHKTMLVLGSLGELVRRMSLSRCSMSLPRRIHQQLLSLSLGLPACVRDRLSQRFFFVCLRARVFTKQGSCSKLLPSAWAEVKCSTKSGRQPVGWGHFQPM